MIKSVCVAVTPLTPKIRWLRSLERCLDVLRGTCECSKFSYLEILVGLNDILILEREYSEELGLCWSLQSKLNSLAYSS